MTVRMTEMRYSQFLGAVESLVGEIVRRSYPASWDEDHITYSITDQLVAKFPRVSVVDFQRPFEILWDAWKLRGTPEKLLGDLAVIVKIKTWEGETVEGVGVLEAKKRSFAKSSFEEIRLDQLRRIQRNAPNSRVLLYDYHQIVGFQDNISALTMNADPFFRGRHFYGHPHYTAFSHAVALPTSIVQSQKIKDTRLYKFSIPFSVQLCSRYLRGYDLELAQRPRRDVKEFIERRGYVRNLLLVGVSTGLEEPTLPMDIDDTVYEPNRLTRTPGELS